MKRIKKKQISFLYNLAADREDDTLLNGKQFNKSPRIFNLKIKDNLHHRITVETIDEYDKFECGDYLKYDGCYWLCIEASIFHGLYCTGTFQKCNWKIYWIDDEGNMQSQWCFDMNTTQYNSGEYYDRYMTVGSSQHMLQMQCNENTVKIDSPMRFFLDKNLKTPTCYQVTQNDNSAYNYGSKGLCQITVVEHGRNTEKDKLVTLDDGTQVWSADYFKNDNTFSGSSGGKKITSYIIKKFDSLYIGKSSTFTSRFKNENGDIVDIEPLWSISDCDFIDDIIIKEDGSSLILSTNNINLDGKSFLLSLTSKDNTSSTSSLKISIEKIV